MISYYRICFLLLAFTASSVAALNTTIHAAEMKWGGQVLKQKKDWYQSAEARAYADIVILYQSQFGAWPKNEDLFVPPVSAESLEKRQKEAGNTLDNGATTLPIRFMARMYQATSEERYKVACLRGIDYLLSAQYPSGGWPQFYPLREKCYYSNITFNDNAMMNVMSTLRDISEGSEEFSFVDKPRLAKINQSLSLGLQCILKLQIRQNGKLTAWCAQYDPNTFQPAWARAYEPPSISGGESVPVVEFLMDIKNPSPEIIAAVEGAVAWFKEVKIEGLRLEKFRDDAGKKDSRVVPDPTAGPLWARFYELETNRPIFLDRDSVFRYSLSEIGQERRGGYSYYGEYATDLIGKRYEQWKAALK